MSCFVWAPVSLTRNRPLKGTTSLFALIIVHGGEPPSEPDRLLAVGRGLSSRGPSIQGAYLYFKSLTITLKS